MKIKLEPFLSVIAGLQAKPGVQLYSKRNYRQKLLGVSIQTNTSLFTNKGENMAITSNSAIFTAAYKRIKQKRDRRAECWD